MIKFFLSFALLFITINLLSWAGPDDLSSNIPESESSNRPVRSQRQTTSLSGLNILTRNNNLERVNNVLGNIAFLSSEEIYVPLESLISQFNELNADTHILDFDETTNQHFSAVAAQQERIILSLGRISYLYSTLHKRPLPPSISKTLADFFMGIILRPSISSTVLGLKIRAAQALAELMLGNGNDPVAYYRQALYELTKEEHRKSWRDEKSQLYFNYLSVLSLFFLQKDKLIQNRDSLISLSEVKTLRFVANDKAYQNAKEFLTAQIEALRLMARLQAVTRMELPQVNNEFVNNLQELGLAGELARWNVHYKSKYPETSEGEVDLFLNADFNFVPNNMQPKLPSNTNRYVKGLSLSEREIDSQINPVVLNQQEIKTRLQLISRQVMYQGLAGGMNIPNTDLEEKEMKLNQAGRISMDQLIERTTRNFKKLGPEHGFGEVR